MPATITKTFSARGSRHTGYVMENEFGAIVATVTETKRGGYITRLYTSPDEYTIDWTNSILAARDIAERHALVMS